MSWGAWNGRWESIASESYIREQRNAAAIIVQSVRERSHLRQRAPVNRVLCVLPAQKAATELLIMKICDGKQRRRRATSLRPFAASLSPQRVLDNVFLCRHFFTFKRSLKHHHRRLNKHTMYENWRRQRRKDDPITFNYTFPLTSSVHGCAALAWFRLCVRRFRPKTELPTPDSIPYEFRTASEWHVYTLDMIQIVVSVLRKQRILLTSDLSFQLNNWWKRRRLKKKIVSMYRTDTIQRETRWGAVLCVCGVGCVKSTNPMWNNNDDA